MGGSPIPSPSVRNLRFYPSCSIGANFRFPKAGGRGGQEVGRGEGSLTRGPIESGTFCTACEAHRRLSDGVS